MADTPNRTTVDFVGDAGPGAAIDQYLPQPGQHVGRRLLKIEDIPAGWFLDSAEEAGVPWAEKFGLHKVDGHWEVREPNLFASNWLDRYGAVRGLSKGVTNGLAASLSLGAREIVGTSGSLLDWARRGGLPPESAQRASRLEEEEDEFERIPHDTPVFEWPVEEEDATPHLSQALDLVEHGALNVPMDGLWGTATEGEVDLDQDPQPALFIVQVVGISSFLGDYGLGRTVKTDSLFPGETKTIHLRTWRSTEESRTEASSIIDSFDEASVERFAETVMNETTDTATQEKTENWYADAEAGGSIGIASANVSGGGGGEYSSGTEEFAHSLDEAVREHTAEASSHRENTVSSSSESSVATEDEEITERTVQNINVSRVLNFTFRELNQEYRVKTHLKDVRIAFSNGNSGSWREEPISGLRKLVEEFIAPSHVDQVCSDILGTVAVLRDANDTPVRILEQLQLDPCGIDFRVRDAEPGDDCVYPAPSADGRMYYRFKRGPLGQAPDEEYPVDGVVMSDRTLVMTTDSVVAEALLGQSVALDDYSAELQLEAIREKRLANDRETLALSLIREGRSDEVELYHRVFGGCCSEEGESSEDTP